MSLLLNKRKREESLNDSNYILNDNASKNNLENNITNNQEDLLEENNNLDNTIKNNKNDAFQIMFRSINSRKDDINNNMILSPLCSNLFFNSFQKLKNFDKLAASNLKSGIVLSKSNSSFANNKKNKLFFTPYSPDENNNNNNNDNNDNNFNFETFCNNNINEKTKINLDLDLFNVSDKKNIFDLNIDNKMNEDTGNDLFAIKQNKFFENIKNLQDIDLLGIGDGDKDRYDSDSKNKKNENVETSKEENNIDNKNNKGFVGQININTNIFQSSKIQNINTKQKNNISIVVNNKPQILNKNRFKRPLKVIRPKKTSQIFSSSRLFQTYHPKIIQKVPKILRSKKKSNKPKIFHIEKIFNKKEYIEANEKEDIIKHKNNDLINRYKISLKKIKQIYLNSCLKIYSYLNDKNSFDENSLNNEDYIKEIKRQVTEIIRNRKISSSKMNEILQVNDDDKYRKHYFMFSSEAKQFCLDLINKKNFPLDITMKMCKVPRKSLRRWSHVGCMRKKGCGRKTKNPKMEAKLVEWYNEVIKKNKCVTAKMIREKAVEISDDKDFLASKGWLEKFKKKNNIQIINNKNCRKSVERNINIEISNKDEKNEKIDYEINIVNENNRGKINKEKKIDNIGEYKYKSDKSSSSESDDEDKE